MRFETAPGRQGQVDFAHFRLPWGKRYALIVVLGYSRLLWVQFYTRQTMKALMHGLESSFSYFGGVPRELLFDQMKAVVIEDGRYDDGALVENPEFMRYAYHWNFRIRACRPCRAQTKGKGGAADPLPQGELLLQAHLHVGRRSQRAGPSLA